MATAPNHPRSLSIGNFDESLVRDAQVLDLAAMTFIDAYGLVAVSCCLQVARRRDSDFRVIAPSSESFAGHLTHMGFRDLLSRYELAAELPEKHVARSSDVVVPLQSAREAGGEEKLSRLLWGQLRDHADPQVLEALAEGVSEMVANALEHSGEDALVMAQVYRAPDGKAPHHDDRVQVVIGDIGVGIRQSFAASGAYDATDDVEAIVHSLEYLSSSIVDDPGRGQGLSTTKEQILGLGGTMLVRSDQGRVLIDANGQHGLQVSPISGVVVCLSLPLYPGLSR